MPVTKEAIFFDRTHLVLARAAEVGEILGLNKEKRLLDLIVGVTNNYRPNGSAFNTYQTSSPWKNVITANELVDWTDVDAAEQLFADMIDPGTGEPVLVRGTTVLVMPAYRHAAHRVFNAAEITYTGGGAATATTAANPLGNYRVHESRLAYRRLGRGGGGCEEVVVHRRLQEGVRLHGELADHGDAGAAGKRGGVQQRRRAAVQGERTRCGGGVEPAVCGEVYGLGCGDRLLVISDR